MLPAEVIKQIRLLQIKAGHLVTDALAGEYSSAFKGIGMEFDKVREYNPGDDVRSIDWNVTARFNTPFVKVFREERELTLMLMVDVSRSQYFGTTGRFKNESAVELASLLAFLATKNNDKVGLIVFSDHVEQLIPPKKGRAHVWKIIRSVLTHQGTGKQTNISTALDTFVGVCKRKSLCFLVSDFCAQGYEKVLSHAARRHDMVCVEMHDSRELELSDSGFVEFADAETGERCVIDTSDPRVRAEYAQHVTQQRNQLHGFFRRQGIDFFPLDTQEPAINPLARYLRQRELRVSARRPVRRNHG